MRTSLANPRQDAWNRRTGPAGRIPRVALIGVLLACAAYSNLAAPLPVSSTAPAADVWPMFRGAPSLDGQSRSALPDKPALLWTFTTQGPVKSSPAVSGGRVFVGSEDGHLYALDAATGAKVWAFKTGGGIESSPLVLDGRVFVGSSDAFLYAVDERTGELRWKYETGDKILGAPNWFKRASGRPAILAGSYDFRLHSVDAATGTSNWVYETGNYINGSPAIWSGRTVFGGCDAILHVIDLEKGEKAAEIEAGSIRRISARTRFTRRIPKW